MSQDHRRGLRRRAWWFVATGLLGIPLAVFVVIFAGAYIAMSSHNPSSVRSLQIMMSVAAVAGVISVVLLIAGVVLLVRLWRDGRINEGS